MNDDEQLSRLLRDAVSDVEPQDRLGELRERTAGSGQSRPWWLATGGAVLATAAAVTLVAALSGDPGPTGKAGPASTRSATDSPAPSPAETSPAPTGRARAVAAYFVGDTPSGPRLYREFQQVVDPSPGLAGLALLASGPDDPDYTSLWPTGSFESVSRKGSLVTIQLGDGAPVEPSALALQQVVYTVSAGLQEPVTVELDTGAEVLGPVTAEPQLDVLSHVNLSDPFEGQVATGKLRVDGVANSFEATVVWTVESTDGAQGMGGAFTAEGYLGERLFPFSGAIDVSSLDPGTYTLTVETDDPSGGAEGGSGVFSDTRTFVLE